MNITKEQADKVIAALSMNRIMARDENGNYTKEITAQVVVEALSIMRGLAEDAEPVAWKLNFADEDGISHREVFHSYKHLQEHVRHNSEIRGLKCRVTPLYTSPQAAQTEAALSEVVRLSEDAGLYGADFQTEAQEREAFEAEFDQLCKDYSIYGTMDARLCKVFFEAGRAGSKP